MSTPASRTADVLVVGAGPTGLMAALVLARNGVEVEIIDPKPGPTRESRALGVQARSMELYAQLGLVDRVLADSYTAPAIQLGWRARTTRRIEFGTLQQPISDYPGLHVFEQSRNEQLLADALAGPLADQGRELRWGERVVDLVPASDGVHALTDGDGQLTHIEARWCIGADGSGSLVRRLLDIPYEGVTDPGRFWVADARGVTGLPDGVINLRFGSDDLLLGFPLGPGGHQRLLGVVADPDTDSGGPTAQTVLPQVAERYGFDYDEIDWFAHYRVHHRSAARFRKGRVFLAGDAAHVHSPVGGQGMNTGLQDAHDLALAIADVVAGRTSPDDPEGDTRLDRYQAERQPVARRLVSVTDRAFGVVSGRRRGRKLLRRQIATWIAPLAATVAPRLPTGERLGGYLGQVRIHYPMPAADDQAVGRRLPPSGANHALLRDFSWQLHRYAGNSAPVEDVAGLGLPDWVTGPYALPADPAGRLDPARLYLVRPDGFVAAAAQVGDPAALQEALRFHGLASGTLMR
ncbi:2-polyprenyl-6-methoxyphenol hydroxylase [Microlunatus endophyticus]|uniref:2-polyprenyl-6-methoxyphenol hydroxylase n=1 Tax=Microlunatus endophyticus TaxID=1716077 RepID=A0A917S7D8_9ACTN|nr:FAD-dependent monooxygenase [Microlunatus endophyticus]GGL62879.1 2-polyprenyl-6-methoxyphenol hydroxylase [Microlunatus endophyticus]